MQNYQQQLQNKFDEAYAQLNEGQKLAVDTTEGPVMVIAGPGTGKTQILAARIGKILMMPDTKPENILCLTYTDAGAIAMRKRLQQFIGPEAYKVHIYTFHAFCNNVIQDNLQLFHKNSMDAVSELESIELLRQLIDGFTKDNPLKRYRGDVYYEINSLRNLFSTMKREGWTPDFINEKIKIYLEDLPLRDEFIYKRKFKEFKAGDVKQDLLNEEKNKIAKLTAAVAAFDTYQQMMANKNRYDFDDMINWVIKMFEENSHVLANYQEKFQYILVDEFQDTSGTQNRLVQLLINYWDEPNIFVVGDDDQSIFRFQGANVVNMKNFAENYAASLTTVVLTANYRSTQPILDVSKSLIGYNNDRLINHFENLTKDLVATNLNLTTLKHFPELHAYNSVSEEMIGITNAVHALLLAGVSPGEIAVIYKENKYGETLGHYFRLKAIPLHSKRKLNLLYDPFIGKLIQILQYINAELDIPYGGDELLFKILHFDFYNIPSIDIAKITVEVNNKKYSGERTSIRKMIYDKANLPQQHLFDSPPHKALVHFSNVVEQLIADVNNVTIQQLVQNIIQRAGILTYVMKNDKKLQLLQKLTAFFNFIKEETARNPDLTLPELVATIDVMKKEALPLPMVVVSGTDKGVNLLTAHGSKGLEFEHVFFAGVNANAWESKRKPNSGYKLPDNLFTNTSIDADSLEELRRLFYVALTRAKKYLYLSFANYNDEGKQLEQSRFVAEIIKEHALEEQHIELTAEEIGAFAELQFVAQAPEIENTEEDFITNLLDKFVMNVTALNNYLKCPLQFYYQNLIRIPSGKNDATEFGSAVHFAVEQLFKKMRDGGKGVFGTADDMIQDFKKYLLRHRENFTKEAFKRRMEQGDTVLRAYHQKYVNQWHKIVAVEQNIRGVTINGVPAKGKIDKMEFDGKSVNVVDYKTGDADKAMNSLKPPNDKDPNGGDYWRQAVFYKLLVDNYEGKDWQVTSAEFDFIEPDKKGQFKKVKLAIMPQDTETVKQQLTLVWDKIQQRDFYTGCGNAACHWCNFVKENKLAVALHDLEDAEGE